jgi:pre-mRNA-splicing factor SPF27
MKVEFERLAQKKPMDVLSMKRYELPPPSTGRMNDLQAWMECVDNSMAQLEHQTTRYIKQSGCLMTCSISIIYPFLLAEF